MGGEKFVAQRNEAKLFFRVSNPREMELWLDAFEANTSHWGLFVNGAEIARQVPPESKTQRARLSANVLRQGINEITLTFDKTLPSAESSNHSLSIVVRSAGEEQGAFGHIFVNGRDESPNARGYNLVVINPEKSGAVEARANFDTFGSEQESERMAEFIAQIPDGRIVAVAASDEASYRLTQAGVDALKALGAQIDLRGKFRWSHALLAVKGSPHTAREAASEIQVSQIIQGIGLTEPTVAARIGEIRIAPAP